MQSCHHQTFLFSSFPLCDDYEGENVCVNIQERYEDEDWSPLEVCKRTGSTDTKIKHPTLQILQLSSASLVKGCLLVPLRDHTQLFDTRMGST